MPELEPELPDLQEKDDQNAWATTPAMRMRKQRYVNQSVVVSVKAMVDGRTRCSFVVTLISQHLIPPSFPLPDFTRQ